MQFFNKRFELDALIKQVNVWHLKNDKVVFTNGCFDILHPGHVEYLHQAKALGNRLIVGINTDHSVVGLGKGDGRPFNNQDARLSIIAALHSVDAVILFDEETPIKLIEALHPDVLVKGGDYNPMQIDKNAKDYIVGSDIMNKQGKLVTAIPFLPGFSTTTLVNKIQELA